MENISGTLEFWEWERKLGSSYASSHLLPTDPRHFTNLQGQALPEGKAATLKDVKPPDNAIWVSDWEVLKPRNSDDNGWEYAWNVTASTWHAQDQGFVRRRKWTRSFRVSQAVASSLAASKQGMDQVKEGKKLLF